MKKLTIALAATMLIVACSEVPEKKAYLLNKVSSTKSGIDFVNLVTEDSLHSIISYIYYYNGGGVAVGDINNDSLPDLYFVSNMGKNKLYINKGNLTFEDISETANIAGNSSWNTGATMVDINNDGLLDIYVCAVSGLLDFKGHNELFINNGDNTFTEQSKNYGLNFEGYSTQSYFFDYDKDDDLDLYIVNHAIHTTLSHGRADLRNQRTPKVGDVLLKNDNGKYVDVSSEANIYSGANGYGLSASIADFNNDGWDDIYVCNDFHEDDYYYLNNKDGSFTESLADAFTTISRFSMGSDAADINGDGYQDLMTLDMLPKDERVLKETEGDDAMFNMQFHLKNLGYKDQYARNMLQINNAGDNFQETALINKIADTDWSWAPLFADFNNDGHQDLFVSNGILRRPNGLDFKKYVASAFKGRTNDKGLEWLYNSIEEMPSGKVTNEIFEGNSKTLSSKTGDWIENTPKLSNGAVYTDLDLDGDLDIVLNNFGETASIYENTINVSKNYISLQFNYKEKNKEGIGTKAIVHNNNKQQLKQLFKSRGFLSSVNNKLHFGLGDISQIDSIQIIWPDNTFQTINNSNINQNITVNYQPNNNNYYSNKSKNNSKFTKTNLINFIHTEDNYNDFGVEKLIPYKISTIGPAIAVADIDNNGYEDVFIGNSSGKKAQMRLNDGKSFSVIEIPEIENDAAFEDNDAVFFDADNDNDLDLYVATGINSSKNKTFEVDRLYINNNGKFERSKNQIPNNTNVTSSVRAYDYDADGDIDLFVGNLSNPNNFGINIESYILINNGKGHFSKDDNFKLSSKVTDAEWKDINGDAIKDLLVATEWDAPKIYINKKGKLSLIDLPSQINGLWQTITTYDIDNDNDQDILLGNWGLNTKFNLNFDGPLLMYHSDFDNNGKSETLIAYNKNGEYYPLNSKDEMASQMNIISKLYVKHTDYAGKSFEDIIRKGTIKKATKFEAHTLASGILINDNGNFNTFKEFPKAFQLAPLTRFSEITLDNKPQLIASGNSYKVNTYHGAYIELKGLIFSDTTNYKSVSSFGIQPFNSQIKKIETIKMKDSNLLLVLSNNNELKLYHY